MLGLLSVAISAAGCDVASSAVAGGGATQPTQVSASASLAQLVEAAATRTLGESVAVSSVIGPFRGKGTFDFPAGSGDEQIEETGGAESLVFEPKTVYDRQTRGEYFAMPAGKAWLSANPAEQGKSRYSLYILQLEDLNPQFLLSEVAWGSVAAWSLGPADLGHTPTHAYTVEVSPATVVSKATGPEGSAIAAAIHDERSAPGGSQATEQEFEVWVDGEGRMAQLRADPPASWGTTTLKVTSFAARPRVSAPPTHITVAIAKVLGSKDSDTDAD